MASFPAALQTLVLVLAACCVFAAQGEPSVLWCHTSTCPREGLVQLANCANALEFNSTILLKRPAEFSNSYCNLYDGIITPSGEIRCSGQYAPVQTDCYVMLEFPASSPPPSPTPDPNQNTVPIQKVDIAWCSLLDGCSYPSQGFRVATCEDVKLIRIYIPLTMPPAFSECGLADGTVSRALPIVNCTPPKAFPPCYLYIRYWCGNTYCSPPRQTASPPPIGNAGSSQPGQSQVIYSRNSFGTSTLTAVYIALGVMIPIMFIMLGGYIYLKHRRRRTQGDPYATSSSDVNAQPRAARQPAPIQRVPSGLLNTLVTTMYSKHMQATQAEEEGEEGCCVICLEPYKPYDMVKYLPCMHFYHQKCIDQWLHHDITCPLCNGNVLQLLAAAEPQVQNGNTPHITGGHSHLANDSPSSSIPPLDSHQIDIDDGRSEATPDRQPTSDCIACAEGSTAPGSDRASPVPPQQHPQPQLSSAGQPPAVTAPQRTAPAQRQSFVPPWFSRGNTSGT